MWNACTTATVKESGESFVRMMCGVDLNSWRGLVATCKQTMKKHSKLVKVIKAGSSRVQSLADEQPTGALDAQVN